MNVLIDTSVWSLGLRRKRRDLNPNELKAYFEWEQLLARGQAAIVGLIRQEILSGIASRATFDSIKQRLEPTPDLPVTTETFVLAAEFFNKCRAAGAAPGAIDMTICAAGHTHDLPIFSTDPDFPGYAKILPIHLYHP